MIFSISQYAQLAGITASTIRYYEDENLLPKAERRSGKRVYFSSDIQRLKLIVAGRKAGFGIQEIKQIMSQNNVAETSLKYSILTAALKKVNLIDQKIQSLENQRQVLINAQSCVCTDLSTCKTYC